MTRLGFLEQLRPSSAGMYLSYYRGFFRGIYDLDPKTVPSRAELEALCERYFAEGRDYKADIGRYFESQKGRAPTSLRTILAAIKTLLSENDVELPIKFWKSLTKRTGGSRPRTIDRIPNSAELRLIIMNMPIQGRTFYMMAASSGMRIGALLALKVSDIDLTTDPTRISVRGEYTKSGNSRITFVSTETKEFIEKWLPQRQAYVQGSAEKAQKSFGYDKIAGDRLFPFSKNVAQELFVNAVKKVPGLHQRDPSTGRATLHPHVLRKRFRTLLGKVNVDLTEALMGHESYLSEAYRRYTSDDIGQFYKDNEHVLAVFSDQTQVAKLKTDLDERDKLIGGTLLRMQAKSDEQEKAIEQLQNLVTTLTASMTDPSSIERLQAAKSAAEARIAVLKNARRSSGGI